MTVVLLAVGAALWLGGGGARPGPERAHHRRPTPGRTRSGVLVAYVLGAAVAAALTSALVGLIATVVVGAPIAAIAFAVVRRQRAQAALLPAAEATWLPLVLDLIGAGLGAGLPLEDALAGATPLQLSWLGARLGRVTAMLRLGAEPEQAWRALQTDPRLHPLIATAVRSANSGVRLAAHLGELAADLRAQARTTTLERAQRAGVWVIAPLGLCFLPAFVCLGIVPVVLGIATSLHPAMP